MSHDSLTLVPANREQTLESRRRTFVQWARGLSLEEYLTRESQLDIAEHAAGKLTTWVLVPRNDPTILNFKCSCETYRRKGLIKQPEASEPEEVIGYGIASVFTPAQNRGRGYAGFMMRLLHWVLAPPSSLPPFPARWGTPPQAYEMFGNASFSVLYSDIGSDFYKLAGPDEAAEGWVVREPYATIWKISENTTSDNMKIDVHYLSEDDCNGIWTRDAEQMKNDLRSSRSRKTAFTFLPNGGVSAFLVRRTAFYMPGQPYEIPEHWGVELCSKEQSEMTDAMPTFATWTLDVRPPPSTLVVTRLRATKDSFPYLVECLLSAAKKSNMERVEIWNLSKELVTLAASLGGDTVLRDEHLNAFKWYGLEKANDLEWAFNEKFCWC